MSQSGRLFRITMSLDDIWTKRRRETVRVGLRWGGGIANPGGVRNQRVPTSWARGNSSTRLNTDNWDIRCWKEGLDRIWKESLRLGSRIQNRKWSIVRPEFQCNVAFHSPRVAVASSILYKEGSRRAQVKVRACQKCRSYRKLNNRAQSTASHTRTAQSKDAFRATR